MRNLIVCFCLLLLANSCKKADNTYEPVAQKLVGSWQLVSLYNKASGVSQTYPNAMRTTTVTFSDTATAKFVLPCNSGGAYYMLDENGGFTLSNESKTALFCSVSENDLENDIFDALQNAYWLEINSTQLRVVAPAVYSNLTFSKL